MSVLLFIFILQDKVRKIDCVGNVPLKTTEKQICTMERADTPAAPSPYACFLDGGKSMMCDNVLVGVSSIVDRCGKDEVSVYSRVSEYRDGIYKIMDQEG